MWTHVCIFESLQVEGSYVGDLLYRILNISTGKFVSEYKFDYILKNFKSLWKMSGFLNWFDISLFPWKVLSFMPWV